ncbi:Hypp3228 [Branchiostoma lanceolatum]|uniref:Hypp3228 protein n=1 Tax=Branchiostoma lanceolatum TaxID=7740 RepID=A0A8K0EWY4_BRALA|nr:Hypp3228 [Branchiostoma lanceolatum]
MTDVEKDVGDANNNNKHDKIMEKTLANNSDVSSPTVLSTMCYRLEHNDLPCDCKENFEAMSQTQLLLLAEEEQKNEDAAVLQAWTGSAATSPISKNSHKEDRILQVDRDRDLCMSDVFKYLYLGRDEGKHNKNIPGWDMCKTGHKEGIHFYQTYPKPTGKPSRCSSAPYSRSNDDNGSNKRTPRSAGTRDSERRPPSREALVLDTTSPIPYDFRYHQQSQQYVEQYREDYTYTRLRHAVAVRSARGNQRGGSLSRPMAWYTPNRTYSFNLDQDAVKLGNNISRPAPTSNLAEKKNNNLDSDEEASSWYHHYRLNQNFTSRQLPDLDTNTSNHSNTGRGTSHVSLILSRSQEALPAGSDTYRLAQSSRPRSRSKSPHPRKKRETRSMMKQALGAGYFPAQMKCLPDRTSPSIPSRRQQERMNNNRPHQHQQLSDTKQSDADSKMSPVLIRGIRPPTMTRVTTPVQGKANS